MIFTFGKYKYRNIDDILNIDEKYLRWVIKLPLIGDEFRNEIIKKLPQEEEEDKSYKLKFGKYKGISLNVIKNEDPKYIQYLLNNEFIKTNMKELYNLLHPNSLKAKDLDLAPRASDLRSNIHL